MAARKKTPAKTVAATKPALPAIPAKTISPVKARALQRLLMDKLIERTEGFKGANHQWVHIATIPVDVLSAYIKAHGKPLRVRRYTGFNNDHLNVDHHGFNDQELIKFAKAKGVKFSDSADDGVPTHVQLPLSLRRLAHTHYLTVPKSKEAEVTAMVKTIAELEMSALLDGDIEKPIRDLEAAIGKL